MLDAGSALYLSWNALGETCFWDFCAHSHRDTNNMFGGCTGIVTLLKPENRDFRQKPDDEQLHVLPHYRPDDTDEFGNVEGQQAKMQSGKKNIFVQVPSEKS